MHPHLSSSLLSCLTTLSSVVHTCMCCPLQIRMHRRMMQVWTRRVGFPDRILVRVKPGSQVTDHGLDVNTIYIDSRADRFFLGASVLKLGKNNETVRRPLRCDACSIT